MTESALIALGGNALIRPGERGTVAEQMANVYLACEPIARLVHRGWKIVVTHGNGPQVGAALLRSERAVRETYPHPLDFCVATTQGEIGYLIQRALRYHLRRLGSEIPVLTLLTQVRIDPDDPAFHNPVKPVGPYYAPDQARDLEARRGWRMTEIPHRGFRRVVPSPDPKEIIETTILRKVLDAGILAIACGGGGIPVVRDENNHMIGKEAVIDKDRSSALLASALGLDRFIIATNFECAFLDFTGPDRRPIGRTTAAEMQAHLEADQFARGSMRPKVEAALRFLADGGREALITTEAKLLDALEDRAGTRILPDKEISS